MSVEGTGPRRRVHLLRRSFMITAVGSTKQRRQRGINTQGRRETGKGRVNISNPEIQSSSSQAGEFRGIATERAICQNSWSGVRLFRVWLRYTVTAWRQRLSPRGCSADHRHLRAQRRRLDWASQGRLIGLAVRPAIRHALVW